MRKKEFDFLEILKPITNQSGSIKIFMNLENYYKIEETL